MPNENNESMKRPNLLLFITDLSVVRQFETDGGLIYGSDRLIWF